MKRTTKILIATAMIAGISGGVFAYGKHNHWGISAEDKVEFITERVTRKLNLNDIQQGNLNALARDILALMNEMHASRETHITQIETMLAEPVLDQAKALNLIQAKTSHIANKAPTVIASVATFLDSLNLEQKAQLQQFVSNRMHHRHGQSEHD